MISSNLTFYEGEANAVEVSISDTSGESLDLAGLDIEYKVLDDRDNTEILRFEVGSGIEIVDPLQGTLRITFTPADTTLDRRRYPHELRLFDAPDYVETVLTGFLIINDSIFVE